MPSSPCKEAARGGLESELEISSAITTVSDPSGVTPASSESTPPSTESQGVTNPSGPSASPSSPSAPPADAAQALAEMQQAEQALSDAKQSGDLAAIGAATERLYTAVQQYLEMAGPSATVSSSVTSQLTETSGAGGG